MVDIQGYGKGYRVCTECNAKMEEGYCIDSGMYYFCSDVFFCCWGHSGTQTAPKHKGSVDFQ